jgi:hypothetical protein
MDLDNFLEPEVALTAAIAAAVFSPRVRKMLRRGLVYGTAGVLIAGDAITSAAKNVSQGAQQMRFSRDGSSNGAEQEKPAAEKAEENDIGGSKA